MTWRAALLAALALAACDQTAIIGETPDGGANGENWATVNLGSLTNDVDILFVIDNSPSMSPKQAELKNRFALLADMFQQFGSQGQPGHYHIGVVTTDLGAGPFTLGGGQCHPGGDHAALMALGSAADADCRPPTGRAYIDLDQVAGTNNLPAGQDLTKTFGCMASVGDRGCGFEMPLEAAYQALHDPPPVNVGFLRETSAVAIVFVTDEDDCSAPPDTDLFDPGKLGQYGALLSYRCSQFGVECSGAMPPYGSSNGPLANCAPATTGPLYQANRYIDYFTRPGGLRLNPADVLLFAIDGPAQPFEVILANPSPNPPGPYKECSGPVDGMTCAVLLNHSCISPTDSTFFGDPAVRLESVVSRSPVTGNITSICAASYVDAIQQLAHTLVSYQNGYGCLPGKPPDPNDARCEVEDHTLHDDGSETVAVIPSCSDGSSPPCWRVDAYPYCTGFDPQGQPTVHLQLTIDRKGMQPPPNTVAIARCVVVTG